MIRAKGTLIGQLSNPIVREYPDIENLEVTPTKEQQIFSHEDSYGYDQVTVKPIPNEYIIPKLDNKKIVDNGIFDANDEGLDGYSSVEVNVPSDPEALISYTSFLDNTLETKITKLPDGITKISDYAFYKVTNLDLKTLPKTVKTIGDHVFDQTNIGDIELHEGITSIGSHLFYYCNNVKNVVIPESVTSLGTHVCNQCPNLLSISFPDSLEEIPQYSCYYSKKLASVKVPKNLKIIGSSAFGQCEKLKSIDIPDSVTTIKESAFRYDLGLTEIKLPSNLTLLEREAFESCMYITSFTIPAGVTVIYNETFASCARAVYFDFLGDITSVGQMVFNQCNSAKKIIFRNVTSVPTLANKNAFSSSTTMTNGTCFIYVPDHLVDSFKAATNWSTHASMIKPISEMEEI